MSVVIYRLDPKFGDVRLRHQVQLLVFLRIGETGLNQVGRITVVFLLLFTGVVRTLFHWTCSVSFLTSKKNSSYRIFCTGGL